MSMACLLQHIFILSKRGTETSIEMHVSFHIPVNERQVGNNYLVLFIYIYWTVCDALGEPWCVNQSICLFFLPVYRHFIISISSPSIGHHFMSYCVVWWVQIFRGYWTQMDYWSQFSFHGDARQTDLAGMMGSVLVWGLHHQTHYIY